MEGRAGFRRKVCNIDCELLICSDIKKKKAGQQTPYGNSPAESSFLNIHRIFFPPVISPFFFHIRGFSLALPSSKSCGESAAPSTYPALQSTGISKITVLLSAWPSTHDGYRIAACHMEILIQQQVLYPVRDTAYVLLFFFFFSKGRKGLMPVEGLFLLQFSHHLHNITHTFFNKSRWDVNPHRAGCQLPGELPCNYAALLPKPSAGKVWMLGSISDRVISSNPNKKRSTVFIFHVSICYLITTLPLSCMAFI